MSIKPVKLNDTGHFLKTVNEMQEKEVDGIIMTPFKAPEITKKINELVDDGFAVVTCNVDSPDSKRMAFAGCNLYKSGFIAGGLMGINVGGQAEIGIVTSYIHYERLRGFMDAISRNYPDIHIADTVEAEEDNVKTFNQTKAMMAKNPCIQAIYAETVAVPGICRALNDLGLHRKVKVIGFDDMPIIRDLMIEGYVNAVVVQNPFWQGYRSFEILWDYLLNRKLPKDAVNYSDIEIRIRESLEEFSNHGK
jgi:ABC-type sugar transport system substrate-binding protein